MSERVHNFSAGPGVLPLDVLMEIAEDIPVYGSAGATVMEISHRSKEYTAITESARALMRKMLGIGDEWHILFLQGGASMQFHQIPLNFLREDGRASYANTGAWSTAAIKEAKRFGQVDIVASSEDKGFSFVPAHEHWHADPSSAYIHFTSNNTIYGTEYRTDPKSVIPLVCDASSDFLSRPMDMSSYGLMYAGAQKNIGPAGVTVVLVKDSFLAERKRDLPPLLDYGVHAAKLYHTPPVFAVYVVEKVLKWLDNLGGLKAIDEINQRKANALYSVIDESEFYNGVAREDSRSVMNVTFRLPNEELEAKFVTEAAAQNLKSLKGHRSAGGIRASIYNACPEASVNALAEFMRSFAKANG